VTIACARRGRGQIHHGRLETEDVRNGVDLYCCRDARLRSDAQGNTVCAGVVNSPIKEYTYTA
jgi:hypothetical protein